MRWGHQDPKAPATGGRIQPFTGKILFVLSLPFKMFHSCFPFPQFLPNLPPLLSQLYILYLQNREKIFFNPFCVGAEFLSMVPVLGYSWYRLWPLLYTWSQWGPGYPENLDIPAPEDRWNVYLYLTPDLVWPLGSILISTIVICFGIHCFHFIMFMNKTLQVSEMTLPQF